MTQAKRSAVQLLFDWEDTYNTDPATVIGISLPVNTIGVKGSQNQSDPQTITGSRNPVEPIFGNLDVSGSLVVPVDEVGIGYWLAALFGAPSTSGTGDPYTHTFTPQSSISSFVMEKGFTDIGRYHKFNGCKVNTLSIEIGGDGELTANIDIIGSNETAGGSSMDSTPTSITFSRLQNFQASIEEGGSSIAIVTACSITFSNNLDGDSYCIGSNGIRGGLSEDVMTISGELTALFEDSTLLGKAVNNTESSIKLTLTSGTHSLEFYLPEVKYGRSGPMVETNAGIKITLPFGAYYEDNAESAAAKVTLINAYADYS